ncbi:hypothetical protein FRC00_013489 [Tulasnella sp. 408]|nr:hypothetical protein FRC00_013489 [Tulasnella sp. 408]
MRQLLVKQVAAGIPSEERDFVFCLLNALPESYSIVKQTILANQKDLEKLDINSIIGLMLQDEIDQKGLHPENVNPEHQLFKGNKGNKRKTAKGSKTGNKAGVCNWCSCEGHYEKECRKKKEAHREAQQGAEKSNQHCAKKKNKNGKGNENSPPNHSTWRATALNDALPEEAKATNGAPATGEWWEFDSGAMQVFHGSLTLFLDYKVFDKPIPIGLSTKC